MHKPPLSVLFGGAAGLALLSLFLDFAPVFDPWAWLVWGREVVALELDTSAGPSWKPFPVGFTTIAAPLGDAAPDAWLAVARFGWLLAAGLAWRVSAQLLDAGRRWRILAGAVAALGLVLLADPFTEWFRQFAGGLSEPLLTALVLLAVDRELNGRRGQAFVSGFAAALIRPETWPFLWLYAGFAYRRTPALRGAVVMISALVLVLWFVPDLLGSGNPFEGALRARQSTGAPAGEALEAIGRAAAMPLAALWFLAVWFAYRELRIGRRFPAAMLAGAGAWIGLVAIGAAIGFAGLPRFVAPAAGIVCVLGGAGFARLVKAALEHAVPTSARFRRGLYTRPQGDAGVGSRARIVAIVLASVLVALAVGGQAAERALRIPNVVEEATAFARDVSDLFKAAEAAGPLTRDCEAFFISDLRFQSALAWQRDRPLADIDVRVESAPPEGTFFVLKRDWRALRAASEVGRPVAAAGQWTTYAVACGEA